MPQHLSFSPRLATVLFFVSLQGLLGGCATREKLAAADVPEQIVLKEPLVIKTTAPIGWKWEHMALPGVYEAERKDSRGVYFYQSGRSIVRSVDVEGREPELFVGGLYVPNKTSQPVEIVWAFEMSPPTVKNLGQYIQERTLLTSAMPGLRPGIGVGANVAGNLVAGALVGGLLAAGEGEITTVAVRDQASSDLVRAARVPKPRAADADTPVKPD